MTIQKCYCDICTQEVKGKGELEPIKISHVAHNEVCKTCRTTIMDVIEKLKMNGEM